MRTRTTPFVALAAAVVLGVGGSAARAIPSGSGSAPRPGDESAATAAKPELQAGRVTFRPVSEKGFPNPKFRVKKKVAPSNDAFGRLSGDGFAAYATGTVLHSDPELAESEDPVTVDMAMADAVYAAQALSGFTDELGRPIVSGLTALSGQAHARAAKLDPPEAIGLDIDQGDPADSKAPPTNRPVVRVTETDLEPALKADLLRAEAAARAVSTGCVIGDDLARAVASADDADVGDTDFDEKSTKPLLSLSAEDGRAVSTSKARTYLEPIPGRPGRFAAVSELLQTIAPVTFGLPETDEKFTLEVGGEWVMRAWTDGTTGKLFFGPENTEEYERPAVRLFRGDELIGVDFTELRDDRTGIFIDGQPIGDIRIGADARAISGKPESMPSKTGTRVSAASDVVVVRLFDSEAELRVGHMEVALAVPAGGVRCPGIGLTKTSDPATIRPGDPFTWNLEVSNPNDCLLEQVRVVDSPSAGPGVDWKALTSVPRATRSPNGDVVFESIGGLGTGEARTLQINAQVEPGSDLGSITNRASATGVCGEAPLVGAAETSTNVGMAVVPALPRPPAGVPASERPPRREAAGTSEREQSAAASSATITRASGGSQAPFGAATRSAAAATRRSTSPTVRSQTAGAAASAPLARSGAETAPYVALAVVLLAAGRILRLTRVRQA